VLADRLQVGAGEDHESVSGEDAQKLFQYQGNFVRKDMLEVMGGIDRVDRCVRHPRHVDDGADDVRRAGRVDVEADFLPRGTVETFPLYLRRTTASFRDFLAN
jgi:hypothetical protein